MLITPETATRLLQDLTGTGPVPAAPRGLNRYHFQVHGNVLIGDVPVRGYKFKQRWRLDEREIRRAGQQLAGLAIDHADLVNARLGPLQPGHGPEGWRARIRDWMDRTAYRETREHGCACGTWPCAREQPNDDGLPCGLTWDRFEQRCGKRTIASTRPLPLLSWSGQHWTLPRAYVALLDRSESLAQQLADKAARCSGCDAEGDPWQWRTSSAVGFQTLCPSCSSTAARPYRDHLRGVVHAALGKGSRADAFLCRLCPTPRRALYWDHCHEHGFLRGPVCASCNAYEGGGWEFIRRRGGVQHLLQCTGCRRQRTLPSRHHPDAVRGLLPLSPHESCGEPAEVRHARVEDGGAVRFTLGCHRHEPLALWEQVVPAPLVTDLVRRFVERALAS
ncbi:endonuclease domain-containing protein [Streptomyces flavidovirens]